MDQRGSGGGEPKSFAAALGIPTDRRLIFRSVSVDSWSSAIGQESGHGKSPKVGILPPVCPGEGDPHADVVEGGTDGGMKSTSELLHSTSLYHPGMDSKLSGRGCDDADSTSEDVSIAASNAEALKEGEEGNGVCQAGRARQVRGMSLRVLGRLRSAGAAWAPSGRDRQPSEALAPELPPDGPSPDVPSPGDTSTNSLSPCASECAASIHLLGSLTGSRREEKGEGEGGAGTGPAAKEEQCWLRSHLLGEAGREVQDGGPHRVPHPRLGVPRAASQETLGPCAPGDGRGIAGRRPATADASWGRTRSGWLTGQRKAWGRAVAGTSGKEEGCRMEAPGLPLGHPLKSLETSATAERQKVPPMIGMRLVHRTMSVDSWATRSTPRTRDCPESNDDGECSNRQPSELTSAEAGATAVASRRVPFANLSHSLWKFPKKPAERARTHEAIKGVKTSASEASALSGLLHEPAEVSALSASQVSGSTMRSRLSHVGKPSSHGRQLIPRSTSVDNWGSRQGDGEWAAQDSAKAMDLDDLEPGATLAFMPQGERLVSRQGTVGGCQEKLSLHQTLVMSVDGGGGGLQGDCPGLADMGRKNRALKDEGKLVLTVHSAVPDFVQAGGEQEQEQQQQQQEESQEYLHAPQEGRPSTPWTGGAQASAGADGTGVQELTARTAGARKARTGMGFSLRLVSWDRSRGNRAADRRAHRRTPSWPLRLPVEPSGAEGHGVTGAEDDSLADNSLRCTTAALDGGAHHHPGLEPLSLSIFPQDSPGPTDGLEKCQGGIVEGHSVEPCQGTLRPAFLEQLSNQVSTEPKLVTGGMQADSDQAGNIAAPKMFRGLPSGLRMLSLKAGYSKSTAETDGQQGKAEGSSTDLSATTTVTRKSGSDRRLWSPAKAEWEGGVGGPPDGVSGDSGDACVKGAEKPSSSEEEEAGKCDRSALRRRKHSPGKGSLGASASALLSLLQGSSKGSSTPKDMKGMKDSLRSRPSISTDADAYTSGGPLMGGVLLPIDELDESTESSECDVYFERPGDSPLEDSKSEDSKAEEGSKLEVKWGEADAQADKTCHESRIFTMTEEQGDSQEGNEQPVERPLIAAGSPASMGSHCQDARSIPASAAEADGEDFGLKGEEAAGYEHFYDCEASSPELKFQEGHVAETSSPHSLDEGQWVNKAPSELMKGNARVGGRVNHICSHPSADLQGQTWLHPGSLEAWMGRQGHASAPQAAVTTAFLDMTTGAVDQAGRMLEEHQMDDGGDSELGYETALEHPPLAKAGRVHVRAGVPLSSISRHPQGKQEGHSPQTSALLLARRTQLTGCKVQGWLDGCHADQGGQLLMAEGKCHFLWDALGG